MQPQKINPIVKPLFVGWSALYLLYAVLGVWLTTGPHALDSRTHTDTTGDHIFNAIWLLLSITQFVVAIFLARRTKPGLLWAAVALAAVSVGILIVPSIIS
jgi:hypothetical protein